MRSHLTWIAFGVVAAAAVLALPAWAQPDGEGRRGDGPRARVLERFDANGDGRLDEGEREAARAAFRARVLERFDADGDGTLSPDERAKAREAVRERACEAFDRDGDGRLDRRERMRARMAMRRAARAFHRAGLAEDGARPITPRD
jgi:hypothetical protein